MHRIDAKADAPRGVPEEGTLGGYLRQLAAAPPSRLRPALIVQGGGMRAIYSMAALAVLEDLGLRNAFSMVLGSSAGVLNSAYFLAGQARESVSIYTEGLSNRNFIAPWRLWKVIDVDRMVDVTLKRHHPIDEDALVAAAPLHAVLADAETAAPQVVCHQDCGFDIYEIFRATVAIPLLYNRKVALGERRYVDGGIADLLPLSVARSLGATEAVVLVTRSAGHRKDASGRAFRTFTRAFPAGQSDAVRTRMFEADPNYNRTMEELEGEHEQSGRTTWTLWPTDLDHLVTRTTTDRGRLLESAARAEADTHAFLRQPHPHR
ncbi:MAG TPA: patatin-like phospholipase family protein [Solirubrobacterales bacterium]|jgi:predicted patatin/cPLA2 family phospholipase|nr:patatin-like phospholipase family protein [Solirubrobacterales bacterium]